MIGFVLMSLAAAKTQDTTAFLDAVAAIVETAMSEVSVDSWSRGGLYINITSFSVLGSVAGSQEVTNSDVRKAVGREFQDLAPGPIVACTALPPPSTDRECSTPHGGLCIVLNGLLRVANGYEATLTVAWTRGSPIDDRKHVLSSTIRFRLRYEDRVWKVEDRTVLSRAFY